MWQCNKEGELDAKLRLNKSCTGTNGYVVKGVKWYERVCKDCTRVRGDREVSIRIGMRAQPPENK